jgi:hypothetical protein
MEGLTARSAETRPAAAAAGDPEIRARLEEIAAVLRKLETSNEAAAARWEDLCASVARVAAESRSRPEWAAHRKAARSIFVEARKASLRRSDISKLFSARTAARSGSELRLEYIFDGKASPADFRESAGGRIELSGKALVLHGSCRFLEGEPFEGALEVRVKLPAGGYVAAAPNVGIAVFTSARDVLAVPGRRPTSILALTGSPPGKEPRDWALFALGYRAPVLSYGDELVEKLHVAGLTEPLELPANAVIFGRTGKPLHTDSSECAWAARSGPYAGPLAIDVAVSADAISWKVNGKEIAGGKGPVLDRWLQGPPRAGSVTLHASGAPLKIASIEVRGQLRERWLEQRIQARAEEAYRGIDPE